MGKSIKAAKPVKKLGVAKPGAAKQTVKQAEPRQAELRFVRMANGEFGDLTFDEKQVLPGSRLSMKAMAPEYYTIIGVDTDDGPEHPLWDPRWKKDRKWDDNEKQLFENMVLSIMEDGVLENIQVVRDRDRILVAEGRTRVMATREANRRRAEFGMDPIMVCSVGAKGDEARIMGIGIVTNTLHRTDSPLVSAEKAVRMMNLDPTKTRAQVARKFNVTEQTLDNWLKLLEAPKEARDAIASGEVSANQVLKSMADGEIASRYESKPPPGEPTPEKPRKPAPASKGRPSGPGRSTIQKVVDAGGGTVEALNVLKWVLGTLSAEEAGLRVKAPKQARQGDRQGYQIREAIRESLGGTWTSAHDLADKVGYPRERVSQSLKLMVGEVEAQGATKARVYRMVQP